MPLLQVTSNLALSEAEKKNALLTLSKAVSELLEKSEDYVMTSWSTAKMTMAGNDAPTAYIELRGLRLASDRYEEMSKELCERMVLAVDCRSDRIFINFIDVAPSNWGWNGKTFG